MATKSLRPFLSACAALIIPFSVSVTTHAQPVDPGPTSTVVFSGVDFAQDSYAAWSGIIVSLERDLSKNGFMFRAVGVNAGYEYDTVGGEIDGDAWIGDVMLGYQFYHRGIRTAAYIGAEYQDHDLTPNDPTNDVNGDEAGFKVVAELDSPYNSRFYYSLIGSYSTAFDTYWTRARVGLRHDRFLFGVEGGGSGNEGYDAQRIGGFLDFPVPMGPLAGNVTLNGGYQFADEDQAGFGGGEGAYGGIGYSFSF